MKRLLAINLWPYIVDSSSLLSLYNSSALSKNEFIIGESALMPVLAHKKTVDRVSYTPGYIQWTHLRTLYSRDMDSRVLTRILPCLESCEIQGFLSNYIDSIESPAVSKVYMDIWVENCIRWGFVDNSETALFLARLTRFWATYLRYFEIDRVIACVSPHSLEDLGCYVVSLALNINTYSLVGGCLNTTFVMSWNTRSPVALDSDSSMKRDVQFNVLQYFKRSAQGLVGFGNAYVGTMADECSAGIKLAKRTLLHDLCTRDAADSIASYHFSQLSRYKRLSINFSALQSIALKHQRSIYFPLHSQPEATTVPCAFQWHKQLEAIKYIRKSYSEDFPLFVKEHPYQFLTIGEIPAPIARQVAAHVRPDSFYNDIAQLPNTYIVDLKIPLSLIIGQIQPLFVNITGSSGMEAYCKGLSVFQLPHTINPYGRLFEDDSMQDDVCARERRTQIYCEKYSVARPTGYTLNGNVIASGDLFEYQSFSNADDETRCSWASIVGFLLRSVS